MPLHLPQLAGRIGWPPLAFHSEGRCQLLRRVFRGIPTHGCGRRPNLPSLDIRALPQLTGIGVSVAYKLPYQYINANLERIDIPHVLMTVMLTTNSEQNTTIVREYDLPVVTLKHAHDFITISGMVIQCGSFIEVPTEDVGLGGLLRFSSTDIASRGVSVIVNLGSFLGATLKGFSRDDKG